MKKPLFFAYINYFYLSLVILWEPLQKAFLPIDGQGRILVLITFLILPLNLYISKQFRKNILSVPALLLLALVIFSAINLVANGYNENFPFLTFFTLFLFKQYAVLLVAMLEAQKDTLKLCRTLLVVFLVYGVLAITVLNSGGDGGREYGELGNAAPLTVMYIIFFCSILYSAKAIKLTTLVAFSIFAILIIIDAATRKALGAAGIMLTFLMLSQLHLKFKSVLFVTFAAIAIYLSFSVILSNSLIGERLATTREIGIELNQSDLSILSYLGDRAVFYVNGWHIFLENPMAGIGLRNYLHTTSSNYVLHTEYIVQLAENGIIGFTLFVLFSSWYIKKLVSGFIRNKSRRDLVLILSGGVASVLFVCFTSWIYSFPQYFIVFGIVAGFVRQSKYTKIQKQ